MITTNPLLNSLQTNFFPVSPVSLTVAYGVFLIQGPVMNHGLLYSFPVIVSRCPRYPGQPRWPSPAQGSYGWQSPGPQPPCWKSGTPCPNPSHTCQTTIASFTWPVSSSAGAWHWPQAVGWGTVKRPGLQVCFFQIQASLFLHLLPKLQTSCPNTCAPFIAWLTQALLGVGRGGHSPGAELRGAVT